MSRINLENASEDVFGKHLPTPYIETVEVYNETINVNISYYTNNKRFDIEQFITYCEISDTENTSLIQAKKMGDLFFETSKLNEIFVIPSTPSTIDIQETEFLDSRQNKIYKFTLSLEISNDHSRENFTVSCFSTSTKLVLDPLSPKKIFLAEISDLSYEIVFANSKINIVDKVVYTLPDGRLTQFMPMRSTTSAFFEIDDKQRKDIISSFMAVIDRYSSSKSTEVLDAIETIKAVLLENSRSSNLITEMNGVRKSFPEKSSATPVGKVYSDLSTTINKVNNFLSTQPRLDKRLVRTSSIKDLRSPELTGKVSSYIDEDERETDSYVLDKKYPHCYTVLDDVTRRVVKVCKLISLFEYEKYFIEKSEISKFLNAEKLILLFNRDDILSSLKVDNLSINYAFNPSTPGSVRKNYSSGFLQEADTFNGGDEIENIGLRNIALSSDKKILSIDTKIFLDFPSTSANSELARYTISLTDQSMSIFYSLKNILDSVIVELEKYVSYFDIEANYNSELEKFNRFFIDKYTASYPEKEKAIWVYSPYYINCLLEIFENKFGGDTSLLLEDTKKTMNLLDPKLAKREYVQAILYTAQRMRNNYFPVTLFSEVVRNRNKQLISFFNFSAVPMAEFDIGAAVGAAEETEE